MRIWFRRSSLSEHEEVAQTLQALDGWGCRVLGTHRKDSITSSPGWACWMWFWLVPFFWLRLTVQTLHTCIWMAAATRCRSNGGTRLWPPRLLSEVQLVGGCDRTSADSWWNAQTGWPNSSSHLVYFTRMSAKGGRLIGLISSVFVQIPPSLIGSNSSTEIVHDGFSWVFYRVSPEDFKK